MSYQNNFRFGRGHIQIHTNPKCKRGRFAKSALIQSAKRGDGMECEMVKWGGWGSPLNPALGAAAGRPANLLERILGFATGTVMVPTSESERLVPCCNVPSIQHGVLSKGSS